MCADQCIKVGNGGQVVFFPPGADKDQRLHKVGSIGEKAAPMRAKLPGKSGEWLTLGCNRIPVRNQRIICPSLGPFHGWNASRIRDNRSRLIVFALSCEIQQSPISVAASAYDCKALRLPGRSSDLFNTWLLRLILDTLRVLKPSYDAGRVASNFRNGRLEIRLL